MTNSSGIHKTTHHNRSCLLLFERIKSRKKINTLHEKQNFRKSFQRKYYIFLIFRNCRKYRIFCKTKFFVTNQ